MHFRNFIIAAAAASIAAAAQAAPAPFLKDAIRGSNAEIAMGQLAMSQGRSADVRRFGRTLVNDHTAARNTATGLARRYRVAVPNGPGPDARAMMRELESLKGPAFDRAFARHMVMDHKKDIAAFEREAGSSDPKDLRMFARSTLPTLRGHLKMAQSIR